MNVGAIFAVLVAGVRGIVLLIARRTSRRSEDAYLAAATVVIALLVSFVAEALSVLRRLSAFFNDRGHVLRLLALEAIVATAALCMLLWTFRASRRTDGLLALAICCFGSIVVLFFCPEWPEAIDTRLWHLVTVALGEVILFGIVRQSLYVLSGSGLSKINPDWLEGLGALSGAFLLFSAFYLITLPRRMLIAAMMGNLLLASTFLARPLELLPSVYSKTGA